MPGQLITVFQLSGDPLEVAIELSEESSDGNNGLATGRQLREAIKRTLDAHGQVRIPVEVIDVLRGGQAVGDDDKIALDADSNLQFAKRQFPLLNFEWMMFHMWENFLGADEFACPTSCEDHVIFYREPAYDYHEISGVTVSGALRPQLYAVNENQLNGRTLLQQVGEELPLVEPEANQLPPCRATVLPHLAQCEDRLVLAGKERILVYTEAEWHIALYQEVEVKGRSWREVFSRYPFEDVIEAFYAQMYWSQMSMGRPSQLSEPRTCRLTDIIDLWLGGEEPSPGNMCYYQEHPTLEQKFKDLRGILHKTCLAGVRNSVRGKLTGEFKMRRSAKVSDLAQHLADLRGCDVSDFTLLVHGKPLSDISVPLLSLVDAMEEGQGHPNFEVSLIRKARD